MTATETGDQLAEDVGILSWWADEVLTAPAAAIMRRVLDHLAATQALAEAALQNCKRQANEIAALKDTAFATEIYGAGSPNGDIIDWLYTFLQNPTDAVPHAVLGIYLARSGYEDAVPLFGQFGKAKEGT